MIYVQLGDEPSNDDPFVAMAETDAVADIMIRAVNMTALPLAVKVALNVKP